MERKIVRIGNSLGIRLPAAFLEELELKLDDMVEIEFDNNLKVITIKSKSTILIDNHLEQTVKRIVDQYLKDKGL